MASVPIPNAYRVLDSQGRIRPGFRWLDAADPRDVRVVLMAEGIGFDESGSADPQLRLSLTELAQLVDAQQSRVNAGA